MTGSNHIHAICAGAAGTVWHLSPDNNTLQFSDIRSCLDYMLSLPVGCVRILASPQNSQLIVDTFKTFSDVRVGTPAACRDATELRDPEISLYRSRQLRVAASLGGWHRLTDAHVTAYELAVAVEQHDAGVLTWIAVERLLQQHMAWTDLQWILGLCPLSTARLLATIRDPRWFVDWRHPDRLSRMRAYLGLSPRVLARAAVPTAETPPAATAAGRAAMTHACWGSQQYLGDSFLRRYARTKEGVIGTVSACHALLVYLCCTWRERLHFAETGRRIELFVPEYLKAMDAEAVAAFKKHREGG